MKVRVNLSLHDKKNADAVVDGRQIVTKMTGNTNFNQSNNPINPTLASVTAALNALESGIVAAQHNGTAPVQAVRVLRHNYDTLATRLCHYVEDTANDTAIPDANREAIITSSGMQVRSQAIPQKHHFEVKTTELSGTVQCVAEGIHGGRGSHLWEYTPDLSNLTGRVSVAPTVPAHTDITGLNPGTKYAFFHKTIQTAGPTEWEGPIFFIAN